MLTVTSLYIGSRRLENHPVAAGYATETRSNYNCREYVQLHVYTG
jgi:hypothetical protein